MTTARPTPPVPTARSRREIVFAIGFAVGSFAYALLNVARNGGKPQPSAMKESTVASAAGAWSDYMPQQQRALNALDAAYLPVLASGGPAALSARLDGDVRSPTATNQDRADVLQWTRRRAWNMCALSAITAAENGDARLRISASSILVALPSPSVTAASAGARLVRLDAMETDAAAQANWRALRARLGV